MAKRTVVTAELREAALVWVCGKKDRGGVCFAFQFHCMSQRHTSGLIHLDVYYNLQASPNMSCPIATFVDQATKIILSPVHISIEAIGPNMLTFHAISIIPSRSARIESHVG